MRRMSRFVPLVVLAAFSSACLNIFGAGDCAGIGHEPPLNVTVRDAAGHALALGAVATFSSGGNSAADSSLSDSLTISGGSPGLTWDIAVSKRYYLTTVLHGVKAPGRNACNGFGGVNTVPAVLSLAAGAPPVRSVSLIPKDFTLDRTHSQDTLGVVVDANPGLSRAVLWQVFGDTDAVSIDSTMGIVSYRCRVHTGFVQLVARSRVDTTVFDLVHVVSQGHPGSPTDPPCP